MRYIVFIGLIAFIASVYADVPVHCLREEVVGKWRLHLGKGGHDKDELNCFKWSKDQAASTVDIELFVPNTALWKEETEGTWTMVYDESMMITFEDLKFWTRFSYKRLGEDENIVKTDCTKGFDAGIFWQQHHKEGELSSYFGCFYAEKIDSEPSISSSSSSSMDWEVDSKKVFEANWSYLNNVSINRKSLVDTINSDSSSTWEATLYPEDMMQDMITSTGRQGPLKAHDLPPVAEYAVSSKFSKYVVGGEGAFEFDWRNKDGVDYTSPVKNQRSCGSCYAFGTLGSLDDRVRVATNNAKQPDYAEQQIVSCADEYSEACQGGWAIPVSAYIERYGLVQESCFPYKGRKGKCSKMCDDEPEAIMVDYQYTGEGYYGGCTEEAMIEDLLENGPLTISIQVYPDFMNYKSGIYEHKGSEHYSQALNEDGDWMETNHLVVFVGFGETEDGTKYWIGRNSWGPRFGEKGYFKIVRGKNNCAIENQSVSMYVK